MGVCKSGLGFLWRKNSLELYSQTSALSEHSQ